MRSSCSLLVDSAVAANFSTRQAGLGIL